MANDTNFDRNRVRGCDFGSEGVHFDVRGGAITALGGCITLPVETAINRRRLNLRFLWYDGHTVSLWWKSTRGVVADEPDSNSQGLYREVWARRRDSKIVA